MAQGRMLKRRITLSKKMAALRTDKAPLLWFYMLPFTDVEGRIDADPEDIRDEILRKMRRGWTKEKIQDCLEQLHEVGLIILYSIDGKQYLQFTRHEEEQSLRRDKEAKSTLPAPLPDQSRPTPALKLSNSNSNSKVKLSKKEYKEKVFLTEIEYQKLVEKFGQQGADLRIEDLSLGISSKGYKYKSHFHTILAWDRRNQKKAAAVPAKVAPIAQKKCWCGKKASLIVGVTGFCGSDHRKEKLGW